MTLPPWAWGSRPTTHARPHPAALGAFARRGPSSCGSLGGMERRSLLKALLIAPAAAATAAPARPEPPQVAAPPPPTDEELAREARAALLAWSERERQLGPRYLVRGRLIRGPR